MIQINLKKPLAERNLTMKELSKKTGINYLTLSRLQTGKTKRIETDYIDKICKALSCLPYEFIIYKEEN